MLFRRVFLHIYTDLGKKERTPLNDVLTKLKKIIKYIKSIGFLFLCCSGRVNLIVVA